ncbi:uncharacterized protein LOC135343185 isoform X2 [Halichondria panicea]|uniref:uncharacterized protein LOC135343185 isoform X2 n=1 Tax=Halichondria panicea TaxID=6063 RepID=UPI00312B870D
MDRSDLRIPLFFGLVCKDCFEADYKNIKLLTTKCSQSQKCTIVLLIHVAVNDEGMLERIRPLPKRLSPGKRFSMCMNARGSCNRGGSCTYAHSRLEQKVWNTQLRRPEVDWKRVYTRCLPFYGWVCEDCFYADPCNTDLLITKCSPSHKSTTVVLIYVAINYEGRLMSLEEIRPFSRSGQCKGNKFLVCKNGAGGCDAFDCTLAHSKTEQEAWNFQLMKQGGRSAFKFGFKKVSAQNEIPPFRPISPSTLTPTTAVSYAQVTRTKTRRPKRHVQACPFRHQAVLQKWFPPFLWGSDPNADTLTTHDLMALYLDMFPKNEKKV